MQANGSSSRIDKTNQRSLEGSTANEQKAEPVKTKKPGMRHDDRVSQSKAVAPVSDRFDTGPDELCQNRSEVGRPELHEAVEPRDSRTAFCDGALKPPQSSGVRPRTNGSSVPKWNDPSWTRRYEVDFRKRYQQEVDRLNRQEAYLLPKEQGWFGPGIALRAVRKGHRRIEEDIRRHVVEFDRVTQLLTPGTETRRKFQTAVRFAVESGRDSGGAKQLLQLLERGGTPLQLFKQVNGMLNQVIKNHGDNGLNTAHRAIGGCGQRYLQQLWSVGDLREVTYSSLF